MTEAAYGPSREHVLFHLSERKLHQDQLAQCHNDGSVLLACTK